MKLKTTQVNMISEKEWSRFVQSVYKKPYNFQQQDGCKERGIYELSVPSKYTGYFKKTTISELINNPEMGVSFKAWLKRKPKQPVQSQEYNNTKKEFEIKKETNQTYIDMWWERNFYPSIEEIANDLFKKELIEKGEYIINIDW